MKIQGKIFVVTGAGSGMGRELSIQLVKMGAKVALADVRESSLKETAKFCGEQNVSIHTVDISDELQVENFKNEVIQIHTAIDSIINNAGIIQPFVHVKDLAVETITKVMNVNFYGTVFMCKAFLPHLMQRPEAHIANVSSMGGFIPFPGQTIYGASKAAVKLFTEGLYAELQGTNVGVTVIHPGAVNTHIMSNSGLQSLQEEESAKQNQVNRALAADKAASVIIQAIEKNKFRVMVGNDARMLDILYRFHPRWAVRFITKQMAKMLPKK